MFPRKKPRAWWVGTLETVSASPVPAWSVTSLGEDLCLALGTLLQPRVPAEVVPVLPHGGSLQGVVNTHRQ